MRSESDPKSTLGIKGSCHTDYTWRFNSTDQGDIYRLFGGSQTYTVERQTAVDLPPMVNFFSNDKGMFTRSSNISYAPDRQDCRTLRLHPRSRSMVCY